MLTGRFNGTDWSTLSPGPYASLLAAASSEYNPHLLSFRISDIPGYSEYLSLFRWMMLTGVKITFSFRHNTAPTGGTAALPILMFSWAPEVAINTAPTTMAKFRERQNIKKYYPGTRRTITKYYRPRLATVPEDINGTEAFGRTARGQYVLTEYPTLQYTGVLLNIDNSANADPINVDIECVYYLRFKGPQ